MTMTPLAADARARRTGPRARAVLALLAALAVAAPVPAVASVPAAGTPAAELQVDGPPPSPPLDFAIAAEADGVADDDGRLVITMSVDNPGFSTVRSGRVNVAVSREPLASRSEIDDWLSGETALSLRRIGSTTMEGVAARGRSSTTTVLEVGDDLEPGVYALRGTYDSAQGPLVSRGVWVVSDEESAGQVAVVVPITASPRGTALLTSDELAELTAPGGELRAQLDAVVGTPAILAIDPAVVASIRVLGSNAPESAAQWLADLLALPHTRFALQFGDADLAVQVGAGLSAPLTVDDLTPLLDLGGFPATGADPSPTPTAEAPLLPDLATLTDIGRARSDVFWPAGGTAGPDVIAALASAGENPAGSLTLVPSDTVRGEKGALARSGDAGLLVYDADVSEALRVASSSDLGVDRAAALAEASAYASFTDGGDPLLVTVDRGGDRSIEALRGAVRAASRLDGRDAIGMERLAAGTSHPVTVRNAQPDARRVAVLESFLDGETDLAQFATVLENPAVLLAPERGDILQLIGNGWLPQRGAWNHAVATHRAETAATLRAVEIVPSPDINLLGSSAPLSFSVRNALPWPARLVLLTEPNDLRLVVKDRIELVAGENQTTRVDVPVEARVANGESSLGLQLRSPTMVPIGDPVTIAVAVRAEWETVGIVVMSVLVGGLLVLGVIRTVLRLRRRRQPADPDAGTEPTAPTPPHADDKETTDA